MPKVAYESRRFQARTMELIDLCNDLIDSYRAQGYSLTLRQVYYRMVALGHIENSQRSYKNLGNHITIEDRTRGLAGNPNWDNPTGIVRTAHSTFKVDRWAPQPYHIEVWVEKDALIGVVGKACRALDVNFLSTRGYISASEMWLGAERMYRAMEEGKDCLLIHLADHDPSGMDMTRDILKRLSTFWADHVDVNRLALNMAQIQVYNPPPFYVKLKDSRSPGYISQFGTDSWELDALDPKVIDEIITDKILEYRDEPIWDMTLQIEKEMRDLIGQGLELVQEHDYWRVEKNWTDDLEERMQDV